VKINIYIYIFCVVEMNKKSNNLQKPQNAGDVSTAIQMNS